MEWPGRVPDGVAREDACWGGQGGCLMGWPGRVPDGMAREGA